MIARFSLCALFLGLVPPALHAQEQLLGGYGTLLGPEDKVNSSGAALGSAAAIVRQDRANYHRFGIRHAEDQGDPWFASSDARAQMQAAIQIAPVNADIIMRHTAWVYVSVYGAGGRISRIVVEVPG